MKLFEAKKQLDQATKLFKAAGLDLNEALATGNESWLADHIDGVTKESQEALETATATAEELELELSTANVKLAETANKLQTAGIEATEDKTLEEAIAERISTAAQEKLSALGHEPVADDVTTDPDAPKSTQGVVEKWQAITDPKEKTIFYNENRSKIHSALNQRN